jgi:broad specificity phosphatase PhoE
VTEQRLLLVRHGVTDWNREGRFQGQLDPPLSDEGRVEAALLAQRLVESGERPSHIVSSPLSRALTTAEVIASTLGRLDAPVLTADVRLVEIGQGEWQGRTHDELVVHDADRYAAWRDRGGEESPPGGEAIEVVAARASAALAELLGRDPWPVCVVSHGGLIRLMARELLGLAARQAWALDVDNASLSVLIRSGDAGDWKVERWNDTRHLLGRLPTHVAEAEGRPVAL